MEKRKQREIRKESQEPKKQKGNHTKKPKEHPGNKNTGRAEELGDRKNSARSSGELSAKAVEVLRGTPGPLLSGGVGNTRVSNLPLVDFEEKGTFWLIVWGRNKKKRGVAYKHGASDHFGNNPVGVLLRSGGNRVRTCSMSGRCQRVGSLLAFRVGNIMTLNRAWI